MNHRACPDENALRFLRRLSVALLIAGLLVPVLLLAAMYFYPAGYSWHRHYISETGLTRLRSGQGNLLSSFLLGSALFCSGLVCIIYFFCRARWGGGPAWKRLLMFLCVLIGGIGLFGIALTPFNLYPDLHNFCTGCGIFLGSGVLLAVCSGSDLFSDFRENLVWFCFLFYVLLTVGVLKLLVRMPGGLPGSPTGQIVQKFAVIAFYVFMLAHLIRLVWETRRRKTPVQSVSGDGEGGLPGDRAEKSS